MFINCYLLSTNLTLFFHNSRFSAQEAQALQGKGSFLRGRVGALHGFFRGFFRGGLFAEDEELGEEVVFLLNQYNKLNQTGQEKALDYLSDLILIEKYNAKNKS